MLGEYVAQVTKDVFTTGKHSVTFDSGDLVQGTYFVKMTTDKFTATQDRRCLFDYYICECSNLF